jgi:molybdopterin converting factor small subunit
MKFSVLLFAVLKDRAGRDSIEITIAESDASIDVARLLRAAGEQHPNLAAWLPHCRVALNCEYAALDQIVEVDDEIAFLPPVAGG